MSEYPGYKNYATFVASVSLSEKIQKLRIERPNMSILDVKRECVEFLIQHSNHDTVGALIQVIADDIDWEFLYSDAMTLSFTS
jgi:hypothetical protein